MQAAKQEPGLFLNSCRGLEILCEEPTFCEAGWFLQEHDRHVTTHVIVSCIYQLEQPPRSSHVSCTCHATRRRISGSNLFPFRHGQSSDIRSLSLARSGYHVPTFSSRLHGVRHQCLEMSCGSPMLDLRRCQFAREVAVVGEPTPSGGADFRACQRGLVSTFVMLEQSGGECEVCISSFATEPPTRPDEKSG
jgi:hypothetical protein